MQRDVRRDIDIADQQKQGNKVR